MCQTASETVGQAGLLMQTASAIGPNGPAAHNQYWLTDAQILHQRPAAAARYSSAAVQQQHLNSPRGIN